VLQGSIASAQSTRRGGGKDSNLCGWQAFTFTFTVDWPVSLVVGRPQLLQYQLLFKHLFTLKYWERQLNGVWLQLQQTRRLPRWASLGVLLQGPPTPSNSTPCLQGVVYQVRNRSPPTMPYQGTPSTSCTAQSSLACSDACLASHGRPLHFARHI
jgi:hypothetical protein